MIDYQTTLENITPDTLEGFFVGWLAAPSNTAFLQILHGSSHICLALEAGQVVGFITAISDGILAAGIPLLEVLPSHQKQGIGQELVRRMLEQLSLLYMIDISCDDDLVAFYERCGLQRSNVMYSRNYRPAYQLR